MKVSGVKPLSPGQAMRVSADGVSVAVFHMGGLLFGVDA